MFQRCFTSQACGHLHSRQILRNGEASWMRGKMFSRIYEFSCHDLQLFGLQ